MVCPPISAHLLHKGLPQSQLAWTITGHSGMETEIIEQLVGATENFKIDPASFDLVVTPETSM